MLVPDPLVVVVLALGADGQLELPFTWPTGIPTGTPIHLQYWIQDSGASYGFAASNALRGTAK